MEIDQKQIENKALQILEAYDINKPVVDVAKIADGEGIKIKEINMPSEYKNVAGFYDKSSKIIYIEASDSPKRKLFSVAHELGHVFLGHQHTTVLYRITREDGEYSTEEKEANSFAAHLLMPDFMLRECMKKYNLYRSDYKIMADIFGVPISSMQYTLDFLK
jgi:Zn-dependent peptidase ImmA (M78 family)